MNPMLLPKVHAPALLKACREFDFCTLRIASFAGMSCAHSDTIVGCHLPTIGKGTGTKVSDLYVAAGCYTCHQLLDGADKRGFIIADTYPAAFGERLLRANHETIAVWLSMGLIEIRGATFV